MTTFQTINPTTGEPISTYHEMPFKETKKIIDVTHQAYLQWKKVPIAEREHLMKKVAKYLLDHKEEYATLITTEMGKTITSARFEIDRCIRICNYYAEHAHQYLSPHIVNTEMKKSYVTYQPMGIVFAIMPWNFPFFQVFRFGAPALMAGNACILKHAPVTTGCALAIEKIFQAVGFPDNVFRVVIANNETAAEIIADPHIIGVSLTGSVRAGKSVAATAGAHLKKVVLELGGSDPYLILEDADLALAAEQCVKSRLNNTGQVCIAAKRLIAVEAVRPEFEKKVIEKVKECRFGDPMDPAVTMGPMARADLRETVHKQVQECIEKGAELVMGGEMVSGSGFFYPPTILKNIKPGMPAFDDEIFGPVIAFIDAKDEQEAIRIANQHPYGLAAAVFTQNTERGEVVAKQLEAGTCFVNQFVLSDPRLPFGGIKESGFGRELSAEGIREFVNIKTIGVK
ncbi:MAG: succinate-semialdehyde dehydrogenase [Gammaproteobacteria bacterium RIFCSPHIGHO2_12_FULL_42_13]|nr:MAG: succinate-semialdehyde dehydrogenase [Gammaproteobacteria bacterium RIFCSPHIGHO2_12_FULL_42_13]